MKTEQPMPIYIDWLSRSISNYEILARSAVPHHGEKGRVVEGIVKSALRTILPLRFSIGTGFAINSKGEVSSQLDVVVYDNISNAPITLEGGIGLFPIECVYGFIEVKSKQLNGEDISDFTKAVRQVRDLAGDKHYVEYRPKEVSRGKFEVESVDKPLSLPPRSFAFCTSCAFKDISSLHDKLKAEAEANLAHIHGLAVLEKNWLIQQLAHKEVSYEFKMTEEMAFQKFCMAVLQSIQSMPMGQAHMERYVG